ncbi:unnamed protein product [Scytosiphon promiscuus]
MMTALPRPFSPPSQQTSGLETAATATASAAVKLQKLLAAPGRRGFKNDATSSSLYLLRARLESSAGGAGDVDVGPELQRRRRVASPVPSDGDDGDDDAGARAGHLQEWEEALVVREESEVFNLMGQCSDGDSFTVSSEAMPDTEGCYSSVAGTSFGEGFLYSTDDSAEKRTIYPKIVTIGGESNYFWAASPLALFSGDDVVIDCLSVETTSTAIHPASATWQCDVDATGQLLLVENDEFFLVCGCGTSTSGISSSSSSSSDISPAPAGESETFTATPTTAFTTAPPGSTTVPGNTSAPTNVPTTAPTSATTSGPPDEEREISGGRPRVTKGSSLTLMINAAAVAAGVVSLAAGVCAANYAIFEDSIL